MPEMAEDAAVEVDQPQESGGDPNGEDHRHGRKRSLAALPDRYRRILELRFLHACSIKEAAAEMGITVANAKVLQYRALRSAAAANERLAP